MELTSLLERMKMEHLLAQLDGVCEHAAKGDLDYKGFLTQALEAEWRGRHQRGVESRLKLARLPWVKTLDQFDFEFQPSIDRRQVRELAGLSFVERVENVVLLGPPGVGKTHLAIALGVKAVEAGHSVLFLTLESLMGRLVRARHENRLDRTLQQLAYPRVLILDELGYLPLTREEASLFFRLLVRRYERASLIVTSNKSFVDWARSSTTRSSPRRSSTGCSITRPPSTSRARAIASGRRRRLVCSGASGGRPTAPANLRRSEQRREQGDQRVGEQGTSYFGAFRTTEFGLDRARRRRS
jgi:DNA replication protein DnaC